MSKNPVVHFEMPYEDAKRVTKFYKAAFGWDMADTGKQMGNYITAGTAETDGNRMVKTPGTINGGFYPLTSSPQSKEPSVVISVDDIKKAMEDVQKAGGKLLGKPMEIPGIGLYVSFKDTEGNRVSLLQANEREYRDHVTENHT
jgi:predicted enzyme related to lactoylglutathione lyase